jgi:AcrR family transcriptional regulator
MAFLPLGPEADSRPDDRFRLYGHCQEDAIPATPRPNPLRRTAILAAAQTCFWKSGIRRTSIEDVANEAGLAKGTIYLYFASKEELFAALAAAFIAGAREQGADVVDYGMIATDMLTRSI